MKKILQHLSVFLVSVFLASLNSSAQTTYVTPDGAGTKSGESWADAAAGSQLQDKINNATAGNEVWVAAGEYQPVSGQSFAMKEGVKIYGGFASAGSPGMADRNWKQYTTTLLGNNSNVVNNEGRNLSNAAVLDGFTVKGGKSSLDGAGIRNVASSPILRNLIVEKNEATIHSAGIYNRNCSPIIRETIVRNNRAAYEGGGISNNNASTIIINVLIEGNYADSYGSAVRNYAGSITLINVTIANNTVGYSKGGTILNVGHTNIIIRNSIIYGNNSPVQTTEDGETFNLDGFTLSNSLIQGIAADPARNLIDGGKNPLFLDAGNADYRLKKESPAKNAGNNSYFQSYGTSDLSGQPRFFESVIDLGAYENQENVLTRYVKQGASGNGYSWENASGDFQTMINEAQSGSEVWVAAGEYQPASGTSFVMKEGVKIYGGFAGTGNPAMTDRNWKTNVTTLKGSGTTVVRNVDLTNSAELNGFTITGGNTGGSGGGICNLSSSPMLNNLIITGNSAESGGGIYNDHSSPVLTNVIISENVAVNTGGGIYNLLYSYPSIKNGVISNNKASTQGGAVFSQVSSIQTLINVTVTGNSAGTGSGAIHNGFVGDGGRAIIHNSVIYGNGVGLAGYSGSYNIDYSLIEGVSANAGSHIIDGTTDPLFKDAANKDYSLKAQSPVINKGNNNYFADAATDKDLAGNARIFETIIDLGAYENQVAAVYNFRYVRQNGTGNGHSWETASGDLQAMINESIAGNQVWVAEGEYQSALNQPFIMKEGVKIYGGFSTTGNPSLADRNWNNYTTILKGNGNRVIENNDNHLTFAAQLNGFTITGGNTTENGGGMYNKNAYPALSNLIFKENTANNWGGGMYNEGNGETLIYNTLFYGNSAGGGGGVFNNLGSTATFINCTFANNSATLNGGAFHNYNNAVTTARNSIFWGNTQAASTQLYSIDGGIINPEYCIIQGGETGITGTHTSVGLIDSDPLFVNSSAGNYSLTACSPAINSGNNTYFVGASQTTDLAGNTRLFGTTIDIGTYEFQSEIQTGADRLAINNDVVNVSISGTSANKISVSDCRVLAIILPNGASAVSGNTTARVWMDSEVKFQNNAPYVQRHYDISPADNAATATAKVTLYFTQPEFDTFNNMEAVTETMQLPVNSDDVSGKANLRIFQYHGISSGNTGLPSSYSGSKTIIDPADTDIIWNNALKRWEVSFDVTGFSGFFAGTVDASPLPVKIVSFKGSLNSEKAVKLEWKVTEQAAIDQYVVEHSANGINFTDAGSVAANEIAATTYNFTDTRYFTLSNPGQQVYYRLRIEELDGTTEFSRIIAIQLSENKSTLSLYPLPAKNRIWLKWEGNNILGTQAQLVDLQGRIVQKISISESPQPIDVSGLTSGMYLIKLKNGATVKVLKE